MFNGKSRNPNSYHHGFIDWLASDISLVIFEAGLRQATFVMGMVLFAYLPV